MEQSLRAMNRQEKQALWCERVAACRQSGLSVQQWCRENDISPKTYYAWQRRLFDLAAKQAGTTFAEVPQSRVVHSGQAVATLRVGDLSAEIYAGTDTTVLEALCRAMRHAE